MFDLGWGELVLIGIVALIAIGPKELPTVLRTIGQALGKVRRMANEFQGQFQEAMREAEIADLKKQADDMASSINSSVTEYTNYDPLADTQKEVERSLELDKPADSAAAAELPPPAEQTPALPEIDVPPPDQPATVTEKDFASAETPAHDKTPDAAGSKA